MRGLSAFLLLPFTLFAAHVVVENEKGEEFLFEVNLQRESLQEFFQLIEDVDEEEADMLVHIPYMGKIALWNRKAERQAGGSLGYPRDYARGFSQQELTDVQFIVRTLADKSLVTIAKERYSLEAAGDRIEDLHPLNFLLAVFTDEEMKVAVRNIRGKGWVWSNFYGGIKQSLVTESEINNVLPHLEDFADKLSIDIQLLVPSVRSRNWDLLMDQLIKHVPRKGDGGRYDV